ncbi:MAG: acylphosphatase [Pseudomonadota bacterium]
MAPEGSPSPLAARRCWVSGRVQGVAFRANTARQAQALGIRGYARNLPDGRVEVLACGADEALEALIAWLHQGPLFARVDAVQVAQVDPGVEQIPADFTTG